MPRQVGRHLRAVVQCMGPAEVVQEVLRKQVRGCQEGGDLSEVQICRTQKSPTPPALARSSLDTKDGADSGHWGKEVSAETCWSLLVLTEAKCSHAPPCSAGGHQQGINISLSVSRSDHMDVPTLWRGLSCLGG